MIAHPGDNLADVVDAASDGYGDVVDLAPGLHSWPDNGRQLTIRPGVTIRGAPNGASTIILRTELGQGIQTDGPGAYLGIRDVVIAYDAVPPPSAIAILNQYVSRLQLRDVHIRGAARGVVFGRGSGYPDVDGLTIESTGAGVSFESWAGAPIGGGAIRRYRAQGISGNGSAAVLFQGPDGWDRLDLDVELSEQHDYGIHVNGGPGNPTGNISYLTLRGCLDGTNGAGLRLDPYAGNIRTWKLLGLGNQGHPNPGHSYGLLCVPAGGARVDQLDLVGCTFADHDREGILLAGPASAYSGVRLGDPGTPHCGQILGPGAPLITYPAGADVHQ